eukprot:12410753-Karenia_brevis.AAC.1
MCIRDRMMTMMFFSGAAAAAAGRSSLLVMGDTNREYVFKANIEVQIIAFLTWFAAANDCFSLLEQPASSIMPEHPGLHVTLDSIRASRTHTWFGAFGAVCPKPTQLWTTLPPSLTQNFNVSRPALLGAEERTREGVHFISNGWFCGGKGLNGTKEWPVGFAKRLADVSIRAQTSTRLFF